MNQATQESSTGQNGGTARNPATIHHNNGGDPIIHHFNIKGVTFNNRQIFNRVDFALHRLAVKPPVSLSPRSSNRRAFFTIEHAKLDTGSVSDPAHQTVQCINLANQMSFAKTANRRVAGHHPNRLTLMGNEGGFCTMSRGSGSGFTAGVAASDNYDIK